VRSGGADEGDSGGCVAGLLWRGGSDKRTGFGFWCLELGGAQLRYVGWKKAGMAG